MYKKVLIEYKKLVLENIKSVKRDKQKLLIIMKIVIRTYLW